MSEDELDVFRRIYDELANYMAGCNQKIPVGKDVFLLSVGHKANCVDMETWKDLDGYDYVDAAYLELLRRFPFANDKEYWIHEPDYKKKLVQTIMESGEFLSLHTEVLHNPYPINERKQRRRKKLYKGSYEQLSQTWYYKLYMTLPVGIRRILKKTAGI